ncbi:benzoate/H(+) symporter BenE family transporter, partial [Amphritea sp.]|uniref:benzoate/H(+) symporter BenE family transporter n=1 Tax=Amphritea sp. TaxID=1872502 RepID=UPI003A94F9B2
QLDACKGYVAGIANGVFYLIGATFSGTIIALFTALPDHFVAVLAGLALLGAISSNLLGAAQETTHFEASLITFIVTASGMNYLGIGAAFWGVIIGLISYLVLYQPFGFTSGLKQRK